MSNCCSTVNHDDENRFRLDPRTEKRKEKREEKKLHKDRTIARHHSLIVPIIDENKYRAHSHIETMSN